MRFKTWSLEKTDNHDAGGVYLECKNRDQTITTLHRELGMFQGTHLWTVDPVHNIDMYITAQHTSALSSAHLSVHSANTRLTLVTGWLVYSSSQERTKILARIPDNSNGHVVCPLLTNVARGLQEGGVGWRGEVGLRGGGALTGVGKGVVKCLCRSRHCAPTVSQELRGPPTSWLFLVFVQPLSSHRSLLLTSSLSATLLSSSSSPPSFYHHYQCFCRLHSSHPPDLSGKFRQLQSNTDSVLPAFRAKRLRLSLPVLAMKLLSVNDYM